MDSTEQKVNKVLSALQKRKIPCSYASDRQTAKEALLNMINAESPVGIGGSVTIKELDIENELLARGCPVFWHWNAKSPEEGTHIRRQALLADYYLCSTNAITLDGRLINIDGTGNRVGAMLFGPHKAIIVAGVNKIAEDYEAAMLRIKNVACPQNARRLKLDTPCAKLDECSECKSAHRMCNVTTVIEGKPNQIDMHVLIVGEALGY